MNKSIAKAGAFAGAIAGTSTVLVLATIYAVQAARVIFEAFILIIGNVILFVPVGALGGAFAGLALGAIGAKLGRLKSGVETGARTGAVYGGIVGGILVGLAPMWVGFGYL